MTDLQHDTTITAIQEHQRTGVCVLALHDIATPVDAAEACSAIDTCLSVCPSAIVVDLRRIPALTSPLMTLLPRWRDRAEAAGLPLEYVAGTELARQVRRSPVRYAVKTHRGVAQASEWAARQPGRQWARLKLPTVPRSVLIAREAVGDLCGVWRLHGVRHQAQLLIGALVSAALGHPGTLIEVTVSVLADQLHVRVREGIGATSGYRPVEATHGPVTPTAWDTARMMFDHAVADWGVVNHPDGRTVWAVLRLAPGQSR